MNFRGTKDQGADKRTNNESSSTSLDIKTVINSIVSIIMKNTDKKQVEMKQNVKTVESCQVPLTMLINNSQIH